MKESKLIYEEPVVEVYVFEAGDVITFSTGDPEHENIGYDSWDGSW